MSLDVSATVSHITLKISHYLSSPNRPKEEGMLVTVSNKTSLFNTLVSPATQRADFFFFLKSVAGPGCLALSPALPRTHLALQAQQ